METDCGPYFLMETAIRVWKGNDTAGQDRMLKCLYKTQRSPLFRQVIYKNASTPVPRLEELAELAFANACNSFVKMVMSGAPPLNESDNYIPYFAVVFRNKFKTLYRTEMRASESKKTFLQTQVAGGVQNAFEREDKAALAALVRAALNELGENCRQVLIWKYEYKWPHEEIASRKGITEEASRQGISRCKKQFLEIWQIIKKTS
jgi:RNA polymerase sigma factor (sigma-70 family)